MDDINFDELDKAVNSALKQSAPKTDAASDDPMVVPSPVQPTEDLPSVPPVVSEQNVLPKRRGQFMDMVHPSSDMIKPTPTPVHRQAVTVQPLNPSIVETPPEPVVPSPLPAVPVLPEEPVAEGQETAATEPGPAVASEWPDPLDVMEQTEKEAQNSTPEILDESTTLISDIAEEEEASPTPEYADQHAEVSEVPADSEAQEEPAQSPFISGAEFEKRPLGAFADTVKSSDGATEPDETAAVQDEDEPEDNALEDVQSSDEASNEAREPEAVTAPVQELRPEVVSVESDDPTRLSEENQDETVTEGAEVQPDVSDGMATSIAPQYTHTEAPTDDQNDHPVFDTKDYHQPLTPPVKHGHTGLIVSLIIVLLALLGACAWYAIAVLKLI